MDTRRRHDEFEAENERDAELSVPSETTQGGFAIHRIRGETDPGFKTYPLSLFDLAHGDGQTLDVTFRGAGKRSLSLCRMSTTSSLQATAKPGAGSELVLLQIPTNGLLEYGDSGNRRELPAGYGLLTRIREACAFHYSAGYEGITCALAFKPLKRMMQVLAGPDALGSFDFEESANLETPALRSFRRNICDMLDRSERTGTAAALGCPTVKRMLISQLVGAWPRKSAVESVARPASSRHVQRSLDFIETHLATPITVADVARVAGVGVRALQSSFRKDLGRTPVQYIIDRRLEQVHTELLAGGSDPISSIASRWGFVHMSDFSRRYRQRFGCTPSETQIRSSRKT